MKSYVITSEQCDTDCRRLNEFKIGDFLLNFYWLHNIPKVNRAKERYLRGRKIICFYYPHLSSIDRHLCRMQSTIFSKHHNLSHHATIIITQAAVPSRWNLTKHKFFSIALQNDIQQIYNTASSKLLKNVALGAMVHAIKNKK